MDLQRLQGIPPLMAPSTLPTSAAASGLSDPQDVASLAGLPTAAPSRRRKPAGKPAPDTASDPTAHAPVSTAEARAVPRALTMESAPPAPEDDGQRERDAAALRVMHATRQRDLPELFRQDARIRSGELQSGKEFGEAAWLTREVALDKSDPVASRLAFHMLVGNFRYPDALDDWQFKFGRLEGPREALDRNLTSIYGWNQDRRLWSEEVLGTLLDGFGQAGLEGKAGPVSARAIRTMFQLAYRLERRAEAELNQEIRTRESPEQDREWSRRAGEYLDRWFKAGRLRVLQDGRELRPGQVSLGEVASRGIPPVRPDGTVDLSARRHPELKPEDEKLVEQLIKSVPWWEKDAAPGIKVLEDLIREHPDQAVRVAAGIVDRALDPAHGRRDDLGALGRLLCEGPEPFRALFRPHLAEMRNYASEMADRDDVAPGNLEGQAKVKFYRSLITAFPEQVDRDLVLGQLSHLLFADEINTRNDAAKLVDELVFPGHPELVAPAMRAMVEHEKGTWLDCDDLLAVGVKHGWRPGPLERDWLLGLFLQPHQREDFSWASLDTVRNVARAAGQLEERTPGLTEGVWLPDTRGQLVPARQALLDRFLSDPAKEPARSLQNRGMFPSEEFFRLFSDRPDPALVRPVVEDLAGDYARCASVLKLDVAGQKRLIALSHLPLDPASAARLEQLLTPEAQRACGDYTGAVDRLTRNALQQRTLAQAADPGCSLSDCLRLGADALHMELARWNFDSDGSKHIGRNLEPVLARAARAGAEERRELVADLLDQVRVATADSKQFKDIPTRAWVHLILARRLAGDDAASSRHVRGLARELLSVDRAFSRLEDLVKSEFLKDVLEGTCAELREGGAPRELMAGVDGLTRVGEEHTYDAQRWRTQALEAFALGAHAQPWAAPVFAGYEKNYEDIYTRYSAVVAETSEGDYARTAQDLGAVDRRLQGVKLEEVLQAFHAMQTCLRDGMEHGRALDEATRQYLLGHAPEEGPQPDVLETPTSVTVGGVRLKKRTSDPAG